MRPTPDNVLTAGSYRPYVRALLAAAGVLALAGSAAAGPPTTHTLRKSASAPIEAIAQDGSLAVWLTWSTQTCDAVHVLSPGSPDRSLPQPSSSSMTCHWDLSDGQPQLAFAARTSTALWTLHQSGPAPFDYVLAARIGGPERRLDRLAHVSTGSGLWLGGVAGSGKTLAYSWVDVEYVDKLACLSGGTCQQRIADGGIKVVSASTVTPLPGAGPALQLAAAAGRLAYIPATTVDKNGAPVPSVGDAIEVVDGITGDLVSQVTPHGLPLAIALSSHVLAVLTQNGDHDRVSWYDPTDGTKLGSVSISRWAAPQLAASDQLIVYRVGRAVRGVATNGSRIRLLAQTSSGAVGLSLENGRLLWAENRSDGTGRLRALAAG
jgi:hypothetical protein